MQLVVTILKFIKDFLNEKNPDPAIENIEVVLI